MSEAVQKILDDAKEADFEAATVIGLTKEGGMMVTTSVNNVAVLHWMLNKSIFDVNVFESNAKPVDQDSEKE
jgi:hypothetical protein